MNVPRKIPENFTFMLNFLSFPSFFMAKYSFLFISLPIPILFVTFAEWMSDFRVGLHKTLWVKQKAFAIISRLAKSLGNSIWNKKHDNNM